MREARQQVVRLNQADRNAWLDGEIETFSHNHRKAVFSRVDTARAGIDPATTKQHLRERRQALTFPERIAGPKNISVHRAAKAPAQAAKGIDPAIRDHRKVLAVIVGKGPASAVHVEAAAAVSIRTDVRISARSFKLRSLRGGLLCICRTGKPAAK